MAPDPPPANRQTLHVKEAPQQDVARGCARLDKQAREALGVNPGDIVTIHGPIAGTHTSALVWRSTSGDEDKGIIHIDNLTRKNAGVRVGDQVVVEKAFPDHAFFLELEPALDYPIEFGEGISDFIKRSLLGRPVVANDIIAVPDIAFFGNVLPFRVIGLGHKEYNAKASIVTADTRVVVLPTADQAMQRNQGEGMTDYRYLCVGCKKEFTLHAAESLDPYEFDPACPWCEDLTGMPCYVPPHDAPLQDHMMAAFQATVMKAIEYLEKRRGI